MAEIDDRRMYAESVLLYAVLQKEVSSVFSDISNSQ
jgi:hypothetical protein